MRPCWRKPPIEMFIDARFLGHLSKGFFFSLSMCVGLHFKSCFMGSPRQRLALRFRLATEYVSTSTAKSSSKMFFRIDCPPPQGQSEWQQFSHGDNCETWRLSSIRTRACTSKCAGSDGCRVEIDHLLFSSQENKHNVPIDPVVILSAFAAGTKETPCFWGH